MVRKHSIVRTKTIKYNTRHGIIFNAVLFVTEPKVMVTSESTKSNEAVDKLVDSVDKSSEKKPVSKKVVDKPVDSVDKSSEKKPVSKKVVDKPVDKVDKYADLKPKKKKVVDKPVDSVDKSKRKKQSPKQG